MTLHTAGTQGWDTAHRYPKSQRHHGSCLGREHTKHVAFLQGRVDCRGCRDCFRWTCWATRLSYVPGAHVHNRGAVPSPPVQPEVKPKSDEMNSCWTHSPVS